MYGYMRYIMSSVKRIKFRDCILYIMASERRISKFPAPQELNEVFQKYSNNI